MDRVSLVHCYSDDNRGDAGIIISTIQLIKSVFPNVEVSLHSTFSEADLRFKRCHFSSSEFSDNLFPSVFPEPSVEKSPGMKRGKGILKVFNFARFLLIALIVLAMPRSKMVRKFLLSSGQRAALENLCNTDCVISKGGSFLYAFKGPKGLFFLVRMLYPLVLSKRLGKKTVLFGQSLGPYSAPFSSWIARFVLKKVDFVYLREDKCLDELKLPKEKFLNSKVIPDAAFFLNFNEGEMPRLLSADIKIGVTVRPYEDDGLENTSLYDGYIDEVANTLLDLKRRYDESVKFYLFAQVTGPSEHEDDRLAVRKLIDVLQAKDGDFSRCLVVVPEMKFPQHYKAYYSEMDFMICTRLHSAIFALGVGVPVVNISYHGTKSQGIMGEMGLPEYVFGISNLSHADISDLIVSSLESSELRRKIEGASRRNIESLKVAFSECFSDD